MRTLPPALPAIAALALVPTVASAERPQTGYEWVDPGMIKVLEPAELSYNVIYLNGCFGPGDCTFTYGFNDSRINRSSIGSGTLSKFAHGPVAWDAVVDCVKKTYEPFDVVITDVDPGNVPHFEAVVAGVPTEIGMSNGVGGVSPFTCGIIDNAITYSFANIYGGRIDEICWTVAQETAHAFGLEHQALCGDPMTYDSGCSDRKWFNNADSRCGEYEARPRNCDCGGSTQNSFEAITDIFGEGTVETPQLTIKSPADGDTVGKGFVVNAELIASVPLTRAELLVNGRVVGERDRAPYSFIAPQGLSNGRMKLEVRVSNVYGKKSTAVINVVQGEACKKSDDCADTEACVDGRCVVGPGQPGGLGEACDGNQQCSSGLCGSSSSGSFCAEQCEVGAGGCPDGFGCLDTGELGVCWKGYDDGTGGCQAAGRGAIAPLGLAFALAVMLLGRRRRRA
jgi:hypothetical protein